LNTILKDSKVQYNIGFISKVNIFPMDFKSLYADEHTMRYLLCLSTAYG